MEFVFIAILVIAVGIALAKAGLKGRRPGGEYQARALMTENEAEFFGRLVVALPEHYIFPQVAMSALIEAADSDRKKAHSDRLRVAQQRVDYVVCDRACSVLAVVELDDRTHSAAKDQVRDARLQQAGIRTVRFRANSKPRVDELRAAILPPETPNLPPAGPARKPARLPAAPGPA